MNESASIGEAATQPLFLCPVCLRKMYRVVGFNPLERYRQMLQVIKQLHSTVLEASPRIEKDCKGADNEGIGGEMVGATVQVCVEVNNNLESNKVNDTETLETLVEPSDQSDQIDHNTTDTSGKGQSNSIIKELVDEDYSDGAHEERFEEAVVWLERVVSSMARFEDQWVELRERGCAKSKVV